MKNTMAKLEEKAGEILLTALIAVGMSVIQNILESHGMKCGPVTDPITTGGIGAGVSGVKVAFQSIKNTLS